MTLEAGKLLGPYEILGSAGAGGMGEVFKARDTRLDREVAIKVLHTKVANSADIKERFEREAKVIAGLNHPNICTLYDIGSDEGIDYLVMEFIEGVTLGDRLAEGPLPSDELLAVAIQVADALDKAHKQGLVHRDLKPGNVMLTKEGAKLLDFGLAKFTPQEGFLDALSSAETRTTPLTTQGAIIGTLQYMAPEQLEGEEADARSDIFAFGATLYQMATGQNAFEGKSRASLIASVLKEQPREISEISSKTPLALEKVITQCLSKDPDLRWQSAGDLKRSLELIRDGGSGVTVGSAGSKAKQSKVSLLAAIVLGMVAIGFASLWWLESSKSLQSIQTRILEPPGAEFARWAGGAVAISPDGDRLAFLASDTSRSDFEDLIWIRPLNSIEAQPLRGTSGATFPFWSPDGKHIGFFADGKLKKILATGGPPLTLCEAKVGRGGSWSKDGVILFTPAMQGLIHRVSAAGGDPEIALELDTAYRDYTHRWVSFLPDGDHFLYFARTAGEAGGEEDAICVASLSSGERKRLFNARSTAEYVDGHIIFLRETTLMAQPFDLSALELNGDVFPIAENASYVEDWSRGIFHTGPDGLIVYRTGNARLGSQLKVFDVNGRLIDTVGESVSQLRLQVSPDETLIAVELNDIGSPTQDIWIYNLKREIRSRLTFGDGHDRAPIWSPDGKRIAYHGARDKFGIYVKDISGSAKEELIFEDTTWITPADWSSDSKFLVIYQLSSGTSGDILLLDLEGDNEPVALMNSEYWESEPDISPDDRWLAYTSDESGADEIYITTFPVPSGKWQVSSKGGDRPRWSDDGTKLFYLDDRDFIMSVDVDGSGESFEPGKITRLFQVSASRPGNIYDVFANGTRFVVNTKSSGGETSSMVLIQNWHSQYEN